MRTRAESKKIGLPNFLIVGAAKSGTTSLYHYLKQHPEVYMSKSKEPCFFTAKIKSNLRKGIGDEIFLKRHVVKNFEEYCKLFESAKREKAVGEASSDNLYFYDKAIQYIKQLLGDPKIIIILRNPMERAFSAYMMLLRDGREYLPFDEALNMEEKRVKEGWSHIWFYKDEGLYYKQVKAYMDNFSNVKVCLFDSLKEDSLSLIKDVYDFLDVDSSFLPGITARYNVSGIPRFNRLNNFFVNPSKLQSITRTVGKFILKDDGWTKLRDTLRAKILRKPKMKLETRHYLQNIFHEDILKLQTLIGRDLNHWLNE